MLKANDKEKILKTASGNNSSCATEYLTVDFSPETIEARRWWDNVFNVL